MDCSEQLYAFFEVKRKTNDSIANAIAERTPRPPSTDAPLAVQNKVKPSTSPSHIFLTALTSMTSGCRKLQLETDRVVQSALTTMDEVLFGSTEDLESQLNEAISSGVSLATTVTEFLKSVDAALKVESEVVAKLRDRRQLMQRDHDALESSRRPRSVLGSIQRMTQQTEQWLLRRDVNNKGVTTTLPDTTSCIDVLAHCRAAGEVLQAMIVDAKLRLALCEEELELFKKDMFLLGRGGVLSIECDDISLDEHIMTTSSVASKTKSTVAATLTNVTHTLAATGLLKSAGSGATTIRQAVNSLRSRGAAGSVPQHPQTHQNNHNASVNGKHRILRITEEESRDFQQEAVLLEQQLTESSAKAAKEVETSIRELSHLTNLLNEQALIQAEQLSIVAKNTEDTLTNVTKASSELQKPARQSSWVLNPTRQLIVVLWICMLMILAAHIMIR
jgi:hypothetical protein